MPKRIAIEAIAYITKAIRQCNFYLIKLSKINWDK